MKKVYAKFISHFLCLLLVFTAMMSKPSTVNAQTVDKYSKYKITKDNALERVVKWSENGSNYTVTYDKLNSKLKIVEKGVEKEVDLKKINSNTKTIMPISKESTQNVVIGDGGGGYTWNLISSRYVYSDNSSFRYGYYRYRNATTGQYAWEIVKRDAYRPKLAQMDAHWTWRTNVDNLHYDNIALVSCAGTSGATAILTAIAAATATTVIGGIIIALGFALATIPLAIAVFKDRSYLDALYEQSFYDVYGY